MVQKNAELEKLRAQGKYMKTFDTDILKLRADELIYTLCMFVKEVKKPNGEEYTPDSILYLTLGIQEYLFENGRIDNIFTDAYYEPFTSALHEIVRDFKLPVNELGYFVTRIEEEHLWEAKQLGAHSPQVLLNTVIYFNTKYFLLKTVEQHKKLSFSHIMKHWKRTLPNPASRENQASVPGLEKKTILLRYYPPAANKPGGFQRPSFRVLPTSNIFRVLQASTTRGSATSSTKIPTVLSGVQSSCTSSTYRNGEGYILCQSTTVEPAKMEAD